jgi:hypothetical protein
MGPMRLTPRGRRQWWSVVLRWGVLTAVVVAGFLYITRMPDRSYAGPFHPLSPEEVALQARLERHVGVLAGDIGQRNIWHRTGLEAAATYIEGVLAEQGYAVTNQAFRVNGVTVKNLEAERGGRSAPGEIVVVGAHYDSVIGSPGANDNASGVAALLEMARILGTQDLARTVRFVAFVNEEPPFFRTEEMGSRLYASRARQRGERIAAMLSIETIGYYSEDPRSQHYPFPFSLFYPDTADFIGFVGNMASRDLVRRAIGTFRAHTPFPSEGIAAPEWITGIGWSDHASFWREGYPAIMITDTALFRYAHYHTPEDTPDKITYARMTRVVTGITRVIVELAGPHLQ